MSDSIDIGARGLGAVAIGCMATGIAYIWYDKLCTNPKNPPGLLDYLAPISFGMIAVKSFTVANELLMQGVSIRQ